MSSLQLATDGVLPLCVIGLATNGYIACDQQEEIKAGGKKKSTKGFQRRSLPDWIESEDEILQEIKAETQRVEREAESAVVDYETPVPYLFSPLIAPKPLEYFTDALDRELAIRLRIAEIKRHALLQSLYAQELLRLEEELAVFLLLAD